MAALAARTAAAWRAVQDPPKTLTDDAILIGPGGQTLAGISLTAETAYLLIDHLRAARPELVHFAGAAHRDQMALEVCREYQRDPTTSEDDLRARASATVYGGGR
jgi:hypothetical protein